MTKPGRDFVKAWREADRVHGEARPSPALDARVQATVAGAGRRWAWAGAVATAALAIALFAASFERGEPKTRVDTLAAKAAIEWPVADAQEETPVTFVPASCAPAQERPDLELAAGCTLRVESPSLSIEALSSVELKNTKEGIRLVRGSASFDVAPVRPGTKVVVLVSGGRIQVVGTRFVVRETGSGGDVLLEEGRITFRDRKGRETDLEPGARHRWSDVEVAESTPAEAATAPKPKRRPRLAAPQPAQAGPRETPPSETPPIPERVAEPVPPEAPPPVEEAPPAEWSIERTARAIDEVTDLRGARRYREAADLIGLLLQAPLDARAAEVLSFERGELLEQKLQDPAACDHWRRHQSRFGEGRYRTEVRAALRRCRRKEETGGSATGE